MNKEELINLKRKAKELKLYKKALELACDEVRDRYCEDSGCYRCERFSACSSGKYEEYFLNKAREEE